MKFAVFFEDDPDADPSIRKTLGGAHLDFLAANGDIIQSAGPCANEDGSPAGGLWIVDCADLASVEALIARDPFWPSGLRRSRRILAWRHVFADGQRCA